MNPLVHFRWYRRWRGGVWGRHSALTHPWKTWTRFDYRPDDFSERLGDEDWRALPPNFCEACAMDLATCDCAAPRPAVVVRVPPNARVTGPQQREKNHDR